MLSIRVSAADFELWRVAAATHGMTVSEWLRTAGDASAGAGKTPGWPEALSALEDRVGQGLGRMEEFMVQLFVMADWDETKVRGHLRRLRASDQRVFGEAR